MDDITDPQRDEFHVLIEQSAPSSSDEAESLLLSGLGGASGVIAGTVAAGAYASSQHWPVFVPAWATAGNLGAALLIGAIAGLYPAIRASRLAPTTALRG